MDQQNKEQFVILLGKYRSGQATPEEINFLEAYYDLFDVNDDLITPDNEADFQQLKTGLKEAIDQQIGLHKKQPARVRPLRWVGVAAAVLVLICVGAAFFRYWPATPEKAPLATVTPAPASQRPLNRPVLQLANGQWIDVDSSGQGIIAHQQGLSISRQDSNTLVYQPLVNTANGDKAHGMNTFTTPRGMKYRVVLSDGSAVVLNAASSLRYPAVFEGPVRAVELEGEAYFEIKKDLQHPFIVRSALQEVQVLGTHFMVNAYPDESNIKTTLLEGAVKVKAEKGAVVMTPGQQVTVDRDDNAVRKAMADTEKEMAWVNNLFAFRQDDLPTVMRQIARWYDVSVEYKGGLPTEKFSGEISRSSSLTDVLQILELNDVHFDVQGNTLTVSYRE
ncbi:anti-sigma factor [Chitinophaga parva]|uniref:Anti-sigma factor n=1 Tax=Chitinophaga parva TaxID=2169414 RepID=A0A2T7BF87_9BACT|nr:FecR family protein [Chitinophaga parva]PUZ24883.1 anti-sigma factor [Chitinophaga parva]